MEKLSITFRAIFNLFRNHEIHEAAFAASHNQHAVFSLDSVMLLLLQMVSWWTRWRLWRWFFCAVIWTIILWIEEFSIKNASIYSWIFFSFHPISPVYVVNFPCLQKSIKPKLLCITETEKKNLSFLISMPITNMDSFSFYRLKPRKLITLKGKRGKKGD